MSFFKIITNKHFYFTSARNLLVFIKQKRNLKKVDNFFGETLGTGRLSSSCASLGQFVSPTAALYCTQSIHCIIGSTRGPHFFGMHYIHMLGVKMVKHKAVVEVGPKLNQSLRHIL